MKVICDKCEYVVDRDKKIDGHLVEEYKNMFGTTCPNCGYFIKSVEKPFIDEKKEMEKEILKEKMREKLRKR